MSFLCVISCVLFPIYSLKVVVFYDDSMLATYNDIRRAETKLREVMAVVEEHYEESTLKTKMEMNATTMPIIHLSGENWEDTIW